MSIVSGYKKFKKYILTSSGFQLVSHWTNANTLQFDDGKTAQAKLGAIDGISSSKDSSSDKIAASTKLVSELNSNFGGCQFGMTPDGEPGYKKDGADTVIPFKSFIALGASADNTFNVSEYSNHSLFTTDNFIVECPASEYTGRLGAYSDDRWTKEVEAWIICNKSYNPSNGILTLNAYIRRRLSWNYGQAEAMDVKTKFYPKVYLIR